MRENTDQNNSEVKNLKQRFCNTFIKIIFCYFVKELPVYSRFHTYRLISTEMKGYTGKVGSDTPKVGPETSYSISLEIIVNCLPHTHHYITTDSLCTTLSNNHFPRKHAHWAKPQFQVIST